jgi:hypothetical protein
MHAFGHQQLCVGECHFQRSSKALLECGGGRLDLRCKCQHTYFHQGVTPAIIEHDIMVKQVPKTDNERTSEAIMPVHCGSCASLKKAEGDWI